MKTMHEPGHRHAPMLPLLKDLVKLFPNGLFWPVVFHHGLPCQVAFHHGLAMVK